MNHPITSPYLFWTHVSLHLLQHIWSSNHGLFSLFGCPLPSPSSTFFFFKTRAKYYSKFISKHKIKVLLFLSCLINFKVANLSSLKLGIITILLQICKSLVNLVQNHQNNKNFNHLSQDIQDSSSHGKLIQTWKLGFEHTNKNHSNNHGKHHQS